MRTQTKLRVSRQRGWHKWCWWGGILVMGILLATLSWALEVAFWIAADHHQSGESKRSSRGVQRRLQH
jgi:hypothetical protein